MSWATPLVALHLESGADQGVSTWNHSSPRDTTVRRAVREREESASGGWTDTYDVTGADVLQVVDCAAPAGARLTYAVALVRDDVFWDQVNPGRGRGLVWLVGRDGNDDFTADPVGEDGQARMLIRRRHPVGIPEADRPPGGLPDPYAR